MGTLETLGAIGTKAENLIDHDGPTDTWGFLKIRVTILGCPHIKDCNVLESILGSPEL